MLGKRIYQRRKELRMTQEELARATKISQGQISLLENGEVEDIQARRLKAIAQKLDVSMDWLLELEPVA